MWRPDFIGMGAHRSGTTWLWQHLRAHPQIWTPPSKELHLFDRRLKRGLFARLPRSSFVTRAYYARFFSKSGFSRELVRGEFTTCYMTLPLADVRLVRATVPNARLLFIMRDPVERAWSHARKDMARMTGVAPEDADAGQFAAFLDDPRVAQRSDYATALERWFAVFDRERMFVQVLEECEADPEAALRRTFEFLGVDPERYPFRDAALGQKVNTRPELPIPEAFRALATERALSMLERLRPLLTDEIPWSGYATGPR